MTRWVMVPVVVLVVLMAAWLRLEAIDSFPPGMSRDEAQAIVLPHMTRLSGAFPLFETEEPEPLYRALMTVFTPLTNGSVSASRAVNAVIGTITVALAYWTALQFLSDLSPWARHAGALAAAGTLAVALGHITLSRSLYRGLLQVPLMLAMTGFVMRGLRRGRWADFAVAGVMAALAILTYTAAYGLPLAFGMLGIALLILQPRHIRRWLPQLLVVALAAVIVLLPMIIRLGTMPESILGRTGAVATSQFNPADAISGMVGQLFTAGDQNPQYNVAQAPVIPLLAQPLFVLGMVCLLIRVRLPQSWYVMALALLVSVPPVLTDELPHGLRVVGWFGVFPLVCAVGVGCVVVVASRWTSPRWLYAAFTLIFGVLMGSQAIAARAVYQDYWIDADNYRRWRVLGTELNHSEWFFRTDIQRVMQWVSEQPVPVLLPFEYVNEIHPRAWLIEAFPQVASYPAETSLPPDTLVVLPRSATDEPLYSDTGQFVLLQQRTVYLLPMVSLADEWANITAASVIEGFGSFPTLADVYALPDDAELTAMQSITPIRYGDDLLLVGWSGDREPSSSQWQITLYWQTLKSRIGHDYLSFVQLLTTDYERISGADVMVGGWPLPTSLWQPGEIYPQPVRFAVPDLEVGAYRLVVGIYPPFGEPVTSYDAEGAPLASPVTITWVKSALSPIDIPSDAVTVDALFADVIQLTAYGAQVIDTEVRVRLYWRLQVDRTALDPTIFVHVLDDTGEIIAQQDVRPYGGSYPVFVWDEGEIVMTEHTLNASQSIGDVLRLRVGLYTLPEVRNLPVVLDGVPNPDPFVLLTVR